MMDLYHSPVTTSKHVLWCGFGVHSPTDERKKNDKEKILGQCGGGDLKTWLKILNGCIFQAFKLI